MVDGTGWYWGHLDLWPWCKSLYNKVCICIKVSEKVCMSMHVRIRLCDKICTCIKVYETNYKVCICMKACGTPWGSMYLYETPLDTVYLYESVYESLSVKNISARALWAEDDSGAGNTGSFHKENSSMDVTLFTCIPRWLMFRRLRLNPLWMPTCYIVHNKRLKIMTVWSKQCIIICLLKSREAYSAIYSAVFKLSNPQSELHWV